MSFGAGMLSTALALLACEAAIWGHNIYPVVPIYDAVIFCDLGGEPPWVYTQVEFVRAACRRAGIPFYVLDTNMHGEFTQKFGRVNTTTLPWCTLDENGSIGRMKRHCTYDYKVKMIYMFVKCEMLGYRKGEHISTFDKGLHEMHIGYGAEEQRRMKPSRHPLFKNVYPLVEMGWTRKECYAYNLEVWGLDTKASACVYCPYHRNCFYPYLYHNHRPSFDMVADMDALLEREQPNSLIRNKLYLSRSCKRVWELTPGDCMDAKYFEYGGKLLWDTF